VAPDDDDAEGDADEFDPPESPSRRSAAADGAETAALTPNATAKAPTRPT
jgi:hypothetical protein